MQVKDIVKIRGHNLDCYGWIEAITGESKEKLVVRPSHPRGKPLTIVPAVDCRVVHGAVDIVDYHPRFWEAR